MRGVALAGGPPSLLGSPADLLAADKAMHQGDLAKYGEMVSSWHPCRVQTAANVCLTLGVAAQVATALRRLNATGRTPITPVPAHKLNVFGKAVESGCLFFGDTMVKYACAQARSSTCDGHHPGAHPLAQGCLHTASIG